MEGACRRAGKLDCPVSRFSASGRDSCGRRRDAWQLTCIVNTEMLNDSLRCLAERFVIGTEDLSRRFVNLKCPNKVIEHAFFF